MAKPQPGSANSDVNIVYINKQENAEALLDAISGFVDAKITESRGFAKWDTVPNARAALLAQIMALIV